MRAGVGSGGRFRKVPEGSGVCWCRFWRQVPEAGSGRFRRVPVCAPGSGVCWCRFRMQLPEGSGECGLLPWNLGRSSHVIVCEDLLVLTLSA